METDDLTSGEQAAILDKRSAAAFLARAGWPGARIETLAGDASFRRYDRVYHNTGQAVLMDAPPPQEDVRPFLAVTRYLENLGFSAPHILGSDIGEGFLLLEDLGDDRYSRVMTRDPTLELPLYQAAIDALVVLHRHTPPPHLPHDGGRHTLPAYDDTLLLKEARLFTDWYLPALYQAPASIGEIQNFENLWRAAFQKLGTDMPVLVLRDYHADNLMWLPNRDDVARVGLLDYQDAVIGHAAYDLVSLLQDARRDVPPELEQAMITRYLDASARAGRPLNEDSFRTAYAILGAQRNAKIIGIFMRLCMRDGKSAYLDMIPRVWGLLERDLAHPMLAGIAAWFDRFCPPEIRRQVPKPDRPFTIPDHAMILAAGLGTRMRPLTDRLPKPLLEIAGRTMIDRALDHLGNAGVTDTVVNLHFLPQLMRSHLATRKHGPRIIFSDETDRLMDSGGGVARALPLLGGAPFFILNSDMIWQDDRFDTLGRLAGAWDEACMDALLLLVPVAAATGYDGTGDFHLDNGNPGRLRRRGADPASDYMFGGIQIMHPRLLDGCVQEPFSLNLLFDKAIQQGRLYGLVHSGDWRHVGTPQAFHDANTALGTP